MASSTPGNLHAPRSRDGIFQLAEQEQGVGGTWLPVGRVCQADADTQPSSPSPAASPAWRISVSSVTAASQQRSWLQAAAPTSTASPAWILSVSSVSAASQQRSWLQAAASTSTEPAHPTSCSSATTATPGANQRDDSSSLALSLGKGEGGGHRVRRGTRAVNVSQLCLQRNQR